MTIKTGVAKTYDIEFEISIPRHRLDFYRLQYQDYMLLDAEPNDHASFQETIMEDLQEDGVFHEIRDAIVKMCESGRLYPHTIITVGWVNRDHPRVHADIEGDALFTSIICNVYGIKVGENFNVLYEEF